jgi:hypothetical protein
MNEKRDFENGFPRIFLLNTKCPSVLLRLATVAAGVTTVLLLRKIDIIFENWLQWRWNVKMITCLP